MPAIVRKRYYDNIQKHRAEQRLYLYQVIAMATSGGSYVPGTLANWQRLAGWLEESASVGVSRLRAMLHRYLAPDQGQFEDYVGKSSGKVN